MPKGHKARSARVQPCEGSGQKHFGYTARSRRSPCQGGITILPAPFHERSLQNPTNQTVTERAHLPVLKSTSRSSSVLVGLIFSSQSRQSPNPHSLPRHVRRPAHFLTQPFPLPRFDSLALFGVTLRQRAVALIGLFPCIGCTSRH